MVAAKKGSTARLFRCNFDSAVSGSRSGFQNGSYGTWNVRQTLSIAGDSWDIFLFRVDTSFTPDNFRFQITPNGADATENLFHRILIPSKNVILEVGGANYQSFSNNPGVSSIWNWEWTTSGFGSTSDIDVFIEV